ncbi:MAG: Ku protein [Smithellaceae bacterium]
MAGRAIWKGNIHFGVIDVPVKLHVSTKEERIQFHLLHKSDHTRLQQQMVCTYEKTPVPREDQIRGFKLDDGRYLLIEHDELEQAEPEDSRAIEVHEFVKSAAIDPVFISRSYYLTPDTKAKEYRALAAAIDGMGLSGICTWTMRKHPYLGSLQMQENILLLSTLRFADEVIPVADLELQKIPLSEKELQIGHDLIDRMTAPFQPQKFADEHQKKLQTLIDKKVRGKKIRILRPRHLKPTASDKLLEALEASLKKVA